MGGSRINRVELIGFYGGDETHALSGWTSTGRELTEERRARMAEFLKLLAVNGHHSPFEKSTLHFLVVCETASHIHLLKHRIGVSVNAESARYKEFKEDKFYIPKDWPRAEAEKLEAAVKNLFKAYHETIQVLVNDYALTRKRAKESARLYLPYASQVALDVSFNFRSFMHFQNLRNKKDAQKEIRDIAASMLSLVNDTGAFSLSLKAFGYE